MSSFAFLGPVDSTLDLPLKAAENAYVHSRLERTNYVFVNEGWAVLNTGDGNLYTEHPFYPGINVLYSYVTELIELGLKIAGENNFEKAKIILNLTRRETFDGK